MSERPDHDINDREIDSSITVTEAPESGRGEATRPGGVRSAPAYLAWIAAHAVAGAMIAGRLEGPLLLFIMWASIPVMIVQSMLVRLGVPHVPEIRGGDLASPVMLYLGPPLFAALLGAAAGLLTWPLAFLRGLAFRAWLLRSALAWAGASLSLFGFYLAYQGLLAMMAQRGAGALVSGLVVSGLAVLLSWPVAWWKDRTIRGRALVSVVILAGGMALGFGMLALPKDLGESISERVSMAFVFGCAGFLSGRPLFRNPTPRHAAGKP